MIDLTRIVGTNAFPVSALHEYAVGLIYDRLQVDPKEVMSGESDIRLPMVNGEMSGNLLEGVTRVRIPDILSPIGGFVPDIALHGKDDRPIRVIEVICTSGPMPKKRDFFKAHSIEIVEVPCKTEADLHRLARPVAPRQPGETAKHSPFPHRPSQWTPWPYRRDIRGPGHSHRTRQTPWEAQNDADERIVKLLNDLAMASPHIRREFYLVMNEELGTIESFLPLRADNPKRDLLYPVLPALGPLGD